MRERSDGKNVGEEISFQVMRKSLWTSIGRLAIKKILEHISQAPLLGYESDICCRGGYGNLTNEPPPRIKSPKNSQELARHKFWRRVHILGSLPIPILNVNVKENKKNMNKKWKMKSKLKINEKEITNHWPARILW